MVIKAQSLLSSSGHTRAAAPRPYATATPSRTQHFRYRDSMLTQSRPQYWRADISLDPPTVEHEAIQQESGMADLMAEIVLTPAHPLAELN